ncbi:MAG: hypothetical protein U0W24_02360 [Bacteroidales bacterium]
MKTKLFLLALTAFFTLSSLSMAKDVKPGVYHMISMKVSDNNKVLLQIEKSDGVKWLKYQFQILNENGEGVYHENFCSKEAINLAFNMSEMPEGTYTFVVLYKYKRVFTKKVNLKITPKQETIENDILVEFIKENE